MPRTYFRTPMEQRYWGKVVLGESNDDCWGWSGSIDRSGYGKISLPGRSERWMKVSRYAAMLHFGMFDRRLHVLHHCDNRLCSNPRHLYLGTHQQNMADMKMRGRVGDNGNAKKTHCPQGHEYTPENTYVSRSNKRHCRACGRDRDRRRARQRRLS